jgi:hypothetical protein
VLLRLIFFIVIFYVAWSIFRGYRISNRSSTRKRPAAAERDGEDMVQDPQCLSYVPKSDAIQQAGKYFCSEACARLYLSR